MNLGRLLLASHNPGKVREIGELLKPYGVEVISAGDLNLPEPEETGATFEANAILKAEAAASGANLPALADDSGFAVAALNGDPGVYSARWAGPEKDFYKASETIVKKLEESDANNRSAAFICALALAFPDGRETLTFEGRIEGRFVWPPRGDKGFGYDPVFVPDGYGETFAEMNPDLKNKISHRAQAFEKFVQQCFCKRP